VNWIYLEYLFIQKIQRKGYNNNINQSISHQNILFFGIFLSLKSFKIKY